MGNAGSVITPYHHYELPFTATTEDITFRFEARPETAGTDSTLLLDNIAINAVPEPTATLLLTAAAALGWDRRRRPSS